MAIAAGHWKIRSAMCGMSQHTKKMCRPKKWRAAPARIPRQQPTAVENSQSAARERHRSHELMKFKRSSSKIGFQSPLGLCRAVEAKGRHNPVGVARFLIRYPG